MPDAAKRLEELLKDDPRRAGPLLHHVRRLYDWLSQYPEDVRVAAIRSQRIWVELFKLRAEHRRADGEAEKARLVGSMRELLTEGFDCDCILHEYEIKRVAKHLEELKAGIERRRKNRHKVIEEKLTQLLAARAGPAPRTSDQAPPPSPRAGPPDAPAPALQADTPSPQGPRRDRRRSDGGRVWRGRGWPGRRRGLSPEETRTLLDFAEKHMPKQVHAQLVTLLAEDPRRAELLLRYIQRLHDRFKRYPPEVGEAFMAGHKINVALFRARGEYLKAADEEAKAALVETMRKLLTRQFRFDQVVKKHEVANLGKHLAELKKELARRRAQRDAVIEEKLQRLIKPRLRPTSEADGPGRPHSRPRSGPPR